MDKKNASPSFTDTDTGAKSVNAMPLLEVNGVSKSFFNNKAKIRVLDDLSFTLAAGETLAVVGASGIGKSTLLHVLGTLDRPDKGTMLFQGKDVFEYSDQQLSNFRNRKMGFIFQFHHLLPEFTAIENTMMPALIRGIAKKQAFETAQQILDRVGLADRLTHKATDLSGGEQQRVALARAIMLKPALLLADEPTGNLDKMHSRQVHQLLIELNQELGMAMVIVTHNMELAALMQRQATIAEGKLAYQN